MNKYTIVTALFGLEAFVWMYSHPLHSCHFAQNVNISDHISDFWMFEELPIFLQPPTVLECANQCLEEERCISFMVNLNTKRCRLHAAQVTESNSLQPADGFLSFDSCRADSYIGHPCDLDAECSLNHTECVGSIYNVGSICQCEAGYSFSPVNKSCLSVCPTYGTEFVGFKDFYISRNNDLEFNDTESICPGCCQERCANETSLLCRSIEVTPTKCYLATVTRLDVPGSYYFHLSLKIAHYQRQCTYE